MKFARSCKYYKEGFCLFKSRLLKNIVISNKTGCMWCFNPKKHWHCKKTSANHKDKRWNTVTIHRITIILPVKKITITGKKYRQISFSFFTVSFFFTRRCCTPAIAGRLFIRVVFEIGLSIFFYDRWTEQGERCMVTETVFFLTKTVWPYYDFRKYYRFTCFKDLQKVLSGSKYDFWSATVLYLADRYV